MKFVFKFWKIIPFSKDFFLSKEVMTHHKALGALIILTYAFFPFDLIPDFFTFFGIIDDVVIATFVVERMVKIAPQSLKDKYKLDN
ncbi:YkvA family protein [Litchfieldia salsa]